MENFYFSKYEERVPYQPVKANKYATFISQVLGIITIIAGVLYFHWRWTSTFNPNALCFSIIVATAETLSFFGICLYIFDLWAIKDHKLESAPHYLSDIEDLDGRADRPLEVDFFIATLNEEMELVRYTVRDTKAVKLPHADMKVNIYVLDDGRRDGRDPSSENFKRMCEEEKVIYLTREDNKGYKAGNLKNGLENSSGDIFVILDADTRPFPDFLKNMTGYFKRTKVVWVQSCHWFYDTTEAVSLSKYLIHTCRISSPKIQNALHFLFGKITTGEDIYGSDPRHFYEVIQRKRNYHNASFCCGASSVHRRSAVMRIANDNRTAIIEKKFSERVRKEKITDPLTMETMKNAIASVTELTPFLYHASEDLYTSMIVLSHKDRYEGVLHPYVESKFLSPQDVDTFVKQRTRYAKGSIDIAFHDNPLFKKGLTFAQRICYFQAVFSYFSCLWLLIFLLSPIFYLFTHVMPVSCSSQEFFKAFIPFFLIYKISEIFASWGVSQKRGKQYYMCLFWINFQSLISVLRGKMIGFGVTRKTQKASEVNPFRYAWPHIAIIALTLLGLLINAGQIYFSTGVLTLGFTLNAAWGLHNCYTLFVFVRAAYWDPQLLNEEVPAKAKGGIDIKTAAIKI